MAHRLHRGLTPADVIRSCEAGERLNRAISSLLEQGRTAASGALRAILTDDDDEKPCTTAARSAVFSALMTIANADAVAVLRELASRGAPGLDVYRAARKLPTGALLHAIDQLGAPADADVLEALEDADLASVGDVIRYCSDGADAENIGAMALELGGTLNRETIGLLVEEARSLCEATSKLPTASAADAQCPGGDGGAAVVPAPAPSDLDNSSSGLEGALGNMLRELGGGGGGGAGGGGLEAIMLGAMGGGGGGGGEVVDVSRDVEEEGPRPGTRSVGC